MIRADGKAWVRPAAISRSAASSASVTISKEESFLPHGVALDAEEARHHLRPGRRGDDGAYHERIATRQSVACDGSPGATPRPLVPDRPQPGCPLAANMHRFDASTVLALT